MNYWDQNPENLERIREIWQKRRLAGTLSLRDMVDFYLTKAEINRQKFLRPTSNHRSEKRYLRKSQTAAKEERQIYSGQILGLAC